MEPRPAGTTGPPVVLVEGESDAIVVRALLEARGARASVRPMGGVTNLLRFLDELGGPAAHVLALVDAGEIRFATGALRRHGIRAETAEELGWHGVFVCERDLEDVLIRALGARIVCEELESLAELTGFRTFAQMPQWRDRPLSDQLHRFAGSGSGRKARLAARLVDRLDPGHLPAPLGTMVEAVLAASDGASS